MFRIDIKAAHLLSHSNKLFLFHIKGLGIRVSIKWTGLTDPFGNVKAFTINNFSVCRQMAAGYIIQPNSSRFWDVFAT